MSALWASGDEGRESKYDGRWIAYVPTWTATTVTPVLVDGTLAAAYLRAGQVIFFTMTLTIGPSTTLGTGVWSFTIPSGLALTGFHGSGGALVYDNSAATYYDGVMVAQTSTTFSFTSEPTSSSFFGSTLPITWAAGDILIASGWFAIS